MNETGGPKLSKPAMAWVGSLVLAVLLSALKSGSIAGLSRLMVVASVAVWLGFLLRHLAHVFEGYYGLGLGWPMLLELGALAVSGALAGGLFFSEDPQIVRLVCFSGLSVALLFSSATRMEEARAALVAPAGAPPIRRATEVLRQSRGWRWLCKRFSQIDFEFARRVRGFFAGPDTENGNLSLAAAVALLTQAAISLIGAALILGSTIFPVPLSPKQRLDPLIKREQEHPHEAPKNPSSQPDSQSEKQVTIAAECGGRYEPGTEVPEPEHSALMLAWQSVPGLVPGPLEALGFEIAGCPQPARRVPGDSGAWFASGYCEGELRSIAIAPRGMSHPVMLLEQAAEFVLPLILNREFVGAVDRFSVAGGDAYVIDSTAGSFVLIRDHVTSGLVERSRRSPNGCDGFVDHDVEYTIVGPGLIEAWRSVAAISLGGVYPIDYARHTDGSESVVFRSPDGIVASGVCSIPQMTCYVDIGSDRIHGGRGTFITQGEVEALVDPES